MRAFWIAMTGIAAAALAGIYAIGKMRQNRPWYKKAAEKVSNKLKGR